MSRTGNITPEHAARKAAELLDVARERQDTKSVAIADGWTRLYGALAGHEPSEMTIRETELDGIDVVIVPEKARDLLIALGWTPPGSRAGGLSGSFSFSDATPIVTCRCGVRCFGDSINDALTAWGAHLTTAHRDEL